MNNKKYDDSIEISDIVGLFMETKKMPYHCELLFHKLLTCLHRNGDNEKIRGSCVYLFIVLCNRETLAFLKIGLYLLLSLNISSV